MVLEYRPFDNDISIETIFKVAAIQNVDPHVDPKSAVKSKGKSSKMPYYVCRYKLIRHSRYILVPVLGEIRSEKKSTTTATSAKKSASKRKLVSPIKITKNGVEKLTRSGSHESDIENVSPNKHKRVAELADTPRAARRNLNSSFGTEPAGDNLTPDVLNYSIVNKTPSTNDLNICLRVSQRQRFSNPKYEVGDEVVSSPSARKRAQARDKTPEKSAKKKTTKSIEVSDDEEATGTPTTTRLRTRRASSAATEQIPTTPKGKSVSTRRSSVTCTTPSTGTLMHPRRSILKTPSKGATVETPTKKRLTLSAVVEELNQDGQVTRTPTRNAKKNKSNGYYMDDIPGTPPSNEKSAKKKESGSKTPKKTPSKTPSKAMTPSSKLKQLRAGEITPSITARSQPVNRRRSQLEIARESLHVSALLKSLPCRETEFENVFHFVEGKLLDKCGGCMYISGEWAI